MAKAMLRKILAAWAATAAFGAWSGHAAAKTIKISIQAMAFDQKTLVAAPGDTVRWSNDDIVPHTVTASGFDSGEIAPGQSWQVTLKKKGKIPYKCSFHPTMTASIDVK
jgi:plastocyanin